MVLESTVVEAKEAIRRKRGIAIEDQVLYYNGRKLGDYEILDSVYPGRGEFVLDLEVRSEGDTIEAGSSIDDAPSGRNMLGEDEDGVTTSLNDADDEEWVFRSVYEPRSKARGQQRFGFGGGRQSTFMREEQVESEDVGDVVKELMERWTTVVE